jgi:hypothetical protein
MGEKWAKNCCFVISILLIYAKNYHNKDFQECSVASHPNFFRQKLAKIADISYHNMDIFSL